MNSDVRVSVNMGGITVRYRCEPLVAQCFRTGMQRWYPDLPVIIDAGSVAGLKEIPCARLYFLAAGVDYDAP